MRRVRRGCCEHLHGFLGLLESRTLRPAIQHPEKSRSLTAAELRGLGRLSFVGSDATVISCMVGYLSGVKKRDRLGVRVDEGVDVDTVAEVDADDVFGDAREKLSTRKFAFADQFFAMSDGKGTAVR
jgi:hypothetical protein